MATQAVLSLLSGSSNTTGVAENAAVKMLDPLLAFLPSPVVPLIRSVLSSSALADWFKLFVLGGLFEFFRRLFSQSWGGVWDACFIRARVEKDDEGFMWLMNYFSKLTAFDRTRNLIVSTRVQATGDFREECNCSDCVSQRPVEEDLDKRLKYYPAYDSSYSFFFSGTYVSVLRTKETLNPLERAVTEGLDFRFLCLSPSAGRNAIKKLLTVAKQGFDEQNDQRISVYVPDQYGGWRWAGSKLRRPWSSVVLQEGVKEDLLADAKDFLQTQSWYVDRGIPYRRGYLLHGVPGSGKTSLIHAIAGETRLDIYVISLSKKSLDDQSLNDLVSQLPPRSIALMEDIDCAFKKSVTARMDKETGNDEHKTQGDSDGKAPSPGLSTSDSSAASNVTLSGLLNAIDGIAAHEGRLLFATTNVLDTLDPALIRPGRMDVVVEFKNATTKQAEQLFKCFYPVPTDTVVEDVSSALEKSLLKGAALPTPPLTPPLTPAPLPGALHHSPTPSSLSFSAATRDASATRFAGSIPSGEFSMATLQGYLMLYKSSPEECVAGVARWVEEEKAKRRKKQEQA